MFSFLNWTPTLTDVLSLVTLSWYVFFIL